MSEKMVRMAGCSFGGGLLAACLMQSITHNMIAITIAIFVGMALGCLLVWSDGYD